MGRVCLLLPSVSEGDALGHDVAGMFETFRAHGIETHVHAHRSPGRTRLPVDSMRRYARCARQPDTVSIYHLTTTWRAGCDHFLSSVGPKVLRYHNVTPPRFFAPYSETLARACALGFSETARIVKSGRVDLYLAASAYNRDELVQLGAPAERCGSLPPFNAIPKLDETPAAIPVLERYLDGSSNILFVGRVVPNKGHRHLLGVLAALRRTVVRPLRLILVGDLQPTCAAYYQELVALARRLAVDDAVVWTGKVASDELKAYWLLAHAFLVMSEHEGFCVPIVEAMAFGVPVIAHRAAAVAETAGDAGIVLDGLDPILYAAAVETILTRPEVHDALAARGRARVRQAFDPPRLAERLVEQVVPLLAQPARTQHTG